MRPSVLPPRLPPKPPRRPRRSWLLSILGFGFAGLVVAVVAAAAAAAYVVIDMSKDLPDYEKLKNYAPPVMTRIHANDGRLIAEYAHERRIFVPINSFPKRVIGAFLSAEDRRFYQHNGIDYQGVFRALLKAAETKIRGGGRRAEGASTITQQVAKNFLLTNERSLERKVKEAILALRIEGSLSKNEILELYLNEIFLGLGSYGVPAAGLNYFNKELKDLTIEEAAYLAALPKAPNNYHPFRFKAKATERRNWIIGQMRENGYITAAEADEAIRKPLTVNMRPFGAHIFAAEFFAEQVRREILAKYGEKELYEGGMSVRTTLDPDLQMLARQSLIDGLVKFDRTQGWRGPVAKIEATDLAEDAWGPALGKIAVPSDIQPWRLGVVLDVQKTKALVGLQPGRLQDGALTEDRQQVEIAFDEMKWAKALPKKIAPKTAADVLAKGDVIYVSPKNPKDLSQPWTLMQIPEVSGGLVAMDPHTGRVLAIAGGFSFSISQFDRAAQAKRQPGSAFKPFVYAAAIDNGYKPTSIVLDAPIEIEQGPGKEIWEPKNYEKEKSFGPATLRQGIERSRNQMTVRLAQDMGMPLVIEYAKRFGIYDNLLPVLSMSLGAGETTLLKLTTAYAMIANGGKEVHATFFDRIQDRKGITIFRHDARECAGCKADKWEGQEEPDIPDVRKQILDPHTAYQMTSIMEGVIQRGTATVLKSVGKPLSGKTGTSNEEKDAWFVGFSPDLVVGVFVGFDTPRPMGKGQTGGAVAAPIFGDFMKVALANKPAAPFRIPPGIKLVQVDPRTGLRAAPGDPSAIVEAFKPDEEPDDAYSVIGFAAAGGDGGAPEAYADDPYARRGETGLGGGRGGVW